jgi:hypothetical protein
VQYDERTQTCMKTAGADEKIIFHLDIERRFNPGDFADLDLAAKLGAPVQSAISVQHVANAALPDDNSPQDVSRDLLLFMIQILRVMDQEFQWPTALVVRQDDGSTVAIRGAET